MSRRGRQRGAALLTAMIIVTLVATLAAGMVWQQWRAVQVEGAERSRVQSGWIITAGLELAKIILVESRRLTNQGSNKSALWSTPLEESRLSTLLNVPDDPDDQVLNSYLSGRIEDAMAKYNLYNLAVNTEPEAFKKEVRTLSLLCETAGVNASVAQTIANGMRTAPYPVPPVPSATPASAPPVKTLTYTTPLAPGNLDQLKWFGVDDASIEALRPYAVLIPEKEATTVNINTASREVLAAVTRLDSSTADRLVRFAKTPPGFKDASMLWTQAGVNPVPKDYGPIGVDSKFYEIYGKVRVGDRVLAERTLVVFDSTNRNSQIKVLGRQRIPATEAGTK